MLPSDLQKKTEMTEADLKKENEVNPSSEQPVHVFTSG